MYKTGCNQGAATKHVAIGRCRRDKSRAVALKLLQKVSLRKMANCVKQQHLPPRPRSLYNLMKFQHSGENLLVFDPGHDRQFILSVTMRCGSRLQQVT